MEVFYWHPLVDSRKTCVNVNIILARAFSLTPIILAGSGKSVIWFVVPFRLFIGTYFPPVPPSFRILWVYAKLDQP